MTKNATNPQNPKKLGGMLDIETLGVSSTAPVLSIGFLIFDRDNPSKVYEALQVRLPLDPQITFLGRKVDASTIKWWLNESEDARQKVSVHLNGSMEDLREKLNGFYEWMVERISSDEAHEQYGVYDDEDPDLYDGITFELWARGPQFDVVILENLFAVVLSGRRMPWKYNDVRDLRTLMSVCNVHTEDVPRSPEYVAHDALDDCRYQLDCYRACVRMVESSPQ